MVQCKDCLWWRKAGKKRRWGECDRTVSHKGQAFFRPGKAVAQNEWLCRGWLETRQDFGCVAGEARPERKEGIDGDQEGVQAGSEG